MLVVARVDVCACAQQHVCALHVTLSTGDAERRPSVPLPQVQVTACGQHGQIQHTSRVRRKYWSGVGGGKLNFSGSG